MERAHAQIAVLGGELPVVAKPFAVLIDTNDPDWTEDVHATKLARRLFEAGCRYFVCFGGRAEAVHDLIDDVIVENDYTDVTTTFHEEESREDVAEFFNGIAAADMRGALVWVRDVAGWSRLL